MTAPLSTTRRIRYASGYIALGMVKEATEELAMIPPKELALPEVLSARIDLHTAKKEWGVVAGFGEQLARLCPENDNGWISWGYALRELNRVEEAKAVLLKTEPFLRCLQRFPAVGILGQSNLSHQP